jgi:hypothetical protein
MGSAEYAQHHCNRTPQTKILRGFFVRAFACCYPVGVAIAAYYTTTTCAIRAASACFSGFARPRSTHPIMASNPWISASSLAAYLGGQAALAALLSAAGLPPTIQSLTRPQARAVLQARAVALASQGELFGARPVSQHRQPIQSLVFDAIQALPLATPAQLAKLIFPSPSQVEVAYVRRAIRKLRSKGLQLQVSKGGPRLPAQVSIKPPAKPRNPPRPRGPVPIAFAPKKP